MVVNGHEVKKIDLSKMLNINAGEIDIEEKTDVSEKEIAVSLRESNLMSNIPKRFYECRFGSELNDIETSVKSFALKDVNDRAILLIGATGTGKTTVSACAMHERAIRGMNSGLYLSMRFFMPMLRTSRSFSAKESEYDLLQKYTETPFLVIDEVGTATNIVEESEFLRTVIAGRYDNNLPIIFISNLSVSNFKLLLMGKRPEDFLTEEAKAQFLKAIEADPIINRLKSILSILVLNGQSRRQIA